MNSPTLNRYPDLSVLLITDGSNGYDTLQQFLLTAEVRLLIADTADRGIALFEDELPNLVFICCSENQNPFALTSRLRERWGCRAHAVIVGGDDTAAYWRRASEAGAVAFLPDQNNCSDADAILQRLRHWKNSCNDTSQQLLESIRTTRMLDALPLGTILLGHGEKIIFANRTACRLTGFSGFDEKSQLDDLFLLLYGVNRDANLLLIRTALHGRTHWKDTLFCGQNNLTLRLELLPLAADHATPSTFQLLIVQDIGNCPTSQPYQTMLSAAAFDLLYFRHYSPREQTKLASAITDGVLPAEETFNIASLFAEAAQRLSSPANLPAPLIPEYLMATCHGQGSLLKETIAALYHWALDTKGTSSVTSSVSLQGRDGNKLCLRFSVTAVDRRLTRSSYQRGDEAVAQQLAQSGLTALKSLRGIGLATTLASLMGSSLILKTVAHEGKTALFDLWLQQVVGHETQQLPSQSVQTVDTREGVRLWDSLPEAAPLSGQLRILVAEDNPLEQLNIKGLIDRLGYQVVLVGNGREAVEECEQNSFDLILMDILMPVMDGFEAVRLIREHERLNGSHTPIVALTSYSLKAVQERCAKAGMDGYLPKPVTQQKFEELTSSFFSAGPAVFNELPTPPAPLSASLPVLNLQEAISNLGSDISFFREMLTLFTTHGYPLLDQLIQQLQGDCDSVTLEHSAHKLKGMAANIGAMQLVDVCKRIQEEVPETGCPQRSAFARELSQAKLQLDTTLEQLDWQKVKEQYTA